MDEGCCPKCKQPMTYLGSRSFTEYRIGDIVVEKKQNVFSGATRASYYHCENCKRKYVFHDGPFGIASCSEKDSLPGEDTPHY